MKALLVFAGGLLCAATLAGWYWLNAFGCGMSTAGCHEPYRFWEDTEALTYFVPPLVIGLVMVAIGLVRRKKEG